MARLLRHRLTFQKRQVLDDGYGNQSGNWSDQFTVRAGITPLKGSEKVIAQRAQGLQPVILTVRYSTATAQISPDWRAVDARTGAIYAIKAGADYGDRRQYLEFQAESGVAA